MCLVRRHVSDRVMSQNVPRLALNDYQDSVQLVPLRRGPKGCTAAEAVMVYASTPQAG